MYEIAVFKAIKPKAPVRIIPLRLSMAIVILVVFLCCGAAAYVALFPVLAPFGIATFMLAAFGCSALALFGGALVGHDYAATKQRMVTQLLKFDIQSAECFSPDDRMEIFRKVEVILNCNEQTPEASLGFPPGFHSGESQSVLAQLYAHLSARAAFDCQRILYHLHTRSKY